MTGSDLRLRTAARQLQADASPEARAAVLRERLRAGDVDMGRLRLAAFCGHLPSQIVQGCGRCEMCHTSWQPRLPENLSICPCCAIDRWAIELANLHDGRFEDGAIRVPYWAAIIAARHAQPHALCCVDHDQVPSPACPEWEACDVTLSAAENWLNEGTRAASEAWSRAWLMAPGAGTAWLPAPPDMDTIMDCAGRIRACARMCDAEKMRAAICSALTTWALA